ETVPLVRPRTATTAELPGPAGLTVSGRVLAAGGGVPAPGAVVTLIDPTGRQLGHAVADAAGRYAVALPAAGSYGLVGSAAGRRPEVATRTVGGSPVEYSLVLSGSTGMTGSVRSDGLPVAGALVVATDPFGEVADSTVTGADGGYRLGELVAGEYVLTVSAEGH